MEFPGLRDTQLLSYLYELYLEATRRARTSKGQAMIINTAGKGVQQAWQSATKGAKSKIEQGDLWNAFFDVAVQEDCWEDVRFVSLSLPIHGFQLTSAYS
jgi:N-terminal acetyltransferase B complex non-catalytic subunit